MPELMVSSQKIAYREAGEGRPALLLVHGAGGSSAHFAGLLGSLGRQHRVVAPDLPGHGRSPGFSRAVPATELLERYRDLLAELAERLGLGRFILVGHSMGGALGLLFGLAYPDRLERLLLVASAARLRVGSELLDAIQTRFAELPGLLAGLGYSPVSDPAQVRRWSESQLQAPTEVVLADFRACDGFDVRSQLAALPMPVTIISAADDRLTPPDQQDRLCQAIPGATLQRLSRAGHFLMMERPQELAGIILGSLRNK